MFRQGNAHNAFVVKDTMAEHKRTTKRQTIYIKFKGQTLQTVLTITQDNV